jgi:hypothetical protein
MIKNEYIGRIRTSFLRRRPFFRATDEAYKLKEYMRKHKRLPIEN